MSTGIGAATIYMLDTYAISEPLKPAPNAGVISGIRANKGRLVMAVTTWHEALFGLARLPKGKRRETVRSWLYDVIAASVPMLPYDGEAAEWHATERARLAAKGRTSSFADGSIAAIAKVRGFTIVTANVKDFELFEDVSVEDWWMP